MDAGKNAPPWIVGTEKEPQRPRAGAGQTPGTRLAMMAVRSASASGRAILKTGRPHSMQLTGVVWQADRTGWKSRNRAHWGVLSGAATSRPLDSRKMCRVTSGFWSALAVFSKARQIALTSSLARIGLTK